MKSLFPSVFIVSFLLAGPVTLTEAQCKQSKCVVMSITEQEQKHKASTLICNRCALRILRKQSLLIFNGLTE